MKKLILIVLFVLLVSILSSSEWIKVNDVDYKLTKIDTLQNIVIADGYYEITITETDTIITYLGGLGSYFYYKGVKQNITLTDEIINNLIEETYPATESEQ